MVTSNYVLPLPQPLEIHDPQVAEKWKRFKRAWTSYELATALKDSLDPRPNPRGRVWGKTLPGSVLSAGMLP